jgi:hypothetical protein
MGTLAAMPPPPGMSGWDPVKPNKYRVKAHFLMWALEIDSQYGRGWQVMHNYLDKDTAVAHGVELALRGFQVEFPK